MCVFGGWGEPKLRALSASELVSVEGACGCMLRILTMWACQIERRSTSAAGFASLTSWVP